MGLKGKKILLAITGGIAAYKTQTLIRSFIKYGAEVQVIISPDAKAFVTEATLSTLSKKPVYSEFLEKNGIWNSHVEMALWADLMVIAPCTSNTLAKIVNGICDNLLIATYMSAKCPVMIAPAMDLDMFNHPSTQSNLQKAEKFGNLIIPSEEGELASGLVGVGRMSEPETIFQVVLDYFNSKKTLSKKTILITAGPTYEPIDPVRFIGNHSSGKMGYAIAEEAASRGAHVVLISGPTSLKIRNPNIEVFHVKTAKEMHEEVFKHYKSCDIAIASAAVADFTPEVVSEEKIKKNDDSLVIKLVKNPDILKEMGERKTTQFIVGFALETQNEVDNAKDKLKRKNLNAIVLNSLRDEGAGFSKDTNIIKIITENDILEYPLKSKTEVACDILDFIYTNLTTSHSLS